MAAMFKGSGLGSRVAKLWFQHILKHKARLAKATQEITPTVKEFHGTLFPVRSDLLRRGEGAVQIIRLTNDEACGYRHKINLQAGRLFVATGVNGAGPRDSCHLTINPPYIRHVTGADRLDNDFILRIVKHGKVVNGSLHSVDLQSAGSCNLAIQFEHYGTDVDHGNMRTEAGEQRPVPPATGSKTKYAPVANLTQPSGAIHGFHGIIKIRLGGRLGKALTLPRPFVPRAPVMLKNRVHVRLLFSWKQCEEI